MADKEAAEKAKKDKEKNKAPTPQKAGDGDLTRRIYLDVSYSVFPGRGTARRHIVRERDPAENEPSKDLDF